MIYFCYTDCIFINLLYEKHQVSFLLEFIAIQVEICDSKGFLKL